VFQKSDLEAMLYHGKMLRVQKAMVLREKQVEYRITIIECYETLNIRATLISFE